MYTLLDTNILLRYLDQGHEHQPAAVAAIDSLSRQGVKLCLVPQVIYEFWVVATRPVERNGLGMSPLEVEIVLDELLSFVELLLDERAIYQHWRALVRTYQVVGKKAHDARLAAAMLRHHLPTILTFNSADFERFVGIQAISPLKMSAG